MSLDLFRFQIDKLEDGGDTQRVRGKGYPGEELTEVHRVMPHGLASSPPAGSHGIGLAAGSRDRVVMLGGEHPDKRQRNVEAGGAVLYDAAGNVIYAKMAEGVQVRAENGTVTLERGAMKVIVSDTRVDLGGPGGQAVQTVGGPSTKVFAIL